MMVTPVSSTPSMRARSTGAAPRYAGSSEKWTLMQGQRDRMPSRRIWPKATTASASAPESAIRSTTSGALIVAGRTTGIPSSCAASATGVGDVRRDRPRARSGWVMTRGTS